MRRTPGARRSMLSRPHESGAPSVIRAVVALVAAAILVVSGTVSATAAPVGAGIQPKTAVAGFSAANIMSDATFYDGKAMTAAEIQSFLDKRISGPCRNGKCLNVTKTGISSKPAVTSQKTGNLVCSAFAGGTLSVAEIIYRTQVACGISAKVILVMLQKEQGLVTSTAPSDWNLRAAMGAYCPDTAPCDPSFAGVGPQIYAGVKQLKMYKAGNFAMQPGSNYITYHPDTSRGCGGSTVNVANYATAALYNYTPYQPNAAAIRAGYGEGDRCSSYGNRNFYSYYTDWFGSTQGGGAPAVAACAQPLASQVKVAAGSYVVSGADSLNARTAPSTTCETGKISLPGGTRVARVGTYGEWVQVIAQSKKYWVHGSYLAPAGAPTVTASSAHVLALDGAGTLWAYPFASGTWGNRVQAATGISGAKAMVAVGDLTGDGIRDVIGVDAAGKARLYPGTGPASFGAAKDLGVNWSGQRLITAAGDFSGDGIADVLSVDGSGRMWLWAGTAQGALAAPLQVGGGWERFTMISGGVDVTGDKFPDVIARTNTGDLLVYPGNGKSGWKPAFTIGVGWGGMTSVFSLGDINGDGAADILARTAQGAMLIYPGTGGGKVAGGPQIGQGWQGMTQVSGAGPHTSARPAAPVAPPASRTLRGGLGDISGDAKPDVAALSSGGDLLLYRGDGKGGWAGMTSLGKGYDAKSHLVALGDFNGDGIPDLGRVKSGGTFFLATSTAAGGIAAEKAIGSGWHTLSLVTGGIDFDGDKKNDVIGRNAAGQLLLYRGNGAGGWAAGAPKVIGTGWNTMTALISAGDFTGDGNADLLSRRADGTLWLYPTNGKGTFLAPRQVGQGWNIMTEMFSPGDFDGDGKTDVLARTANGDLFLYRGDGKGGWLGQKKVGTVWQSMTSIR